MKTLLAIANGLVLAACTSGVRDWRFWVLALWTGLIVITWGHLTRREMLEAVDRIIVKGQAK